MKLQEADVGHHSNINRHMSIQSSVGGHQYTIESLIESTLFSLEVSEVGGRRSDSRARWRTPPHMNINIQVSEIGGRSWEVGSRRSAVGGRGAEVGHASEMEGFSPPSSV